jgi:hypothetical protein
VNAPAGAAENDTEPVGVDAIPAPVSRTVAVQTIDCLVESCAGVHVTVDAVLRGVETVVSPWLGACVLSPRYVAVTVCLPPVGV